MPLYEFLCLKCEAVREELLPINGEAPLCCGQRMFKGFATIAHVQMGKFPPSLRKLDHGTAPFTRGDTDEKTYRDRRGYGGIR